MFMSLFRYASWLDAGYYKAIVTIDGAYDFEVIFLVTVKGEISCKYSGKLPTLDPANVSNCNFGRVSHLGLMKRHMYTQN